MAASSASIASATDSLQVTTIAVPPGPCSAWAARSDATSAGGASSSATTTSSDGPAGDSMPTTPAPATSRLAMLTNTLPGPTTTSTGRIDSVP